MRTAIALLLVCILVSTASIANAGRARATLFTLGDEGYKFRVSAGVAWYHDDRQYQYVDNLQYDPLPVDALALYIQTPVASIFDMDICFGGVTPLGYAERTRPEFSLCKLIGSNLEVGAAWVMSPYNAFCAMVGWRF